VSGRSFRGLSRADRHADSHDLATALSGHDLNHDVLPFQSYRLHRGQHLGDLPLGFHSYPQHWHFNFIYFLSVHINNNIIYDKKQGLFYLFFSLYEIA
jgi:hypothetical protein